jgi:hypothetical protein
MKRNITAIILTAFLATALSPPLACAQEQSEDSSDRDAVRDAINEIKQKKVVDVLELADDEEQTFLDVYNRWEEVRWTYRERRDVLMEELRAAFTATDDSRPLPDVLDDVDAVDAESRGSEDRLRNEFRTLLSEEQYAKLLLFEDSFNRNLRRLVQERQLEAPPHEAVPAEP